MRKFILIGLIVLVTGILVFVPGRNWARNHVNNKTAVTDHPLLCTNCHLHIHKRSVFSGIDYKDYLSPLNLAVSGDGRDLFVVARDADRLLKVDISSGRVTQRIDVGKKPHSVVLGSDGRYAYVSNQWSDNVSVVNLGTNKTDTVLSTGNGPAGLALSADGKTLYVVNTFSSSLSVIDLASGAEIRRLNTGNNPTGAQLSPEGNELYVTARRAEVTPYGEPVKTELTIVDDKSKRLKNFLDIESAYLMENIAFTPSGDFALVSLIRPKNNVPTLQVEKGWMMTHGFAIIERKENGRIIQLLLDEPNAYYPDPFDVVITPDGKRAFISSSGVNCISVIDIDSVRNLIAESTQEMLDLYPDYLGISNRYIIKRIPTGANPKGLSLSPDGKTLYVAEHLQDRIGVISTENMEMTGSIDLGGPRKVSVTRQGRRLLNNAGTTFQNQYACYTCHPDEHEDGLMYNMASKDMGRNITNTQSIRDIGDTPPFKWNGKNQTVFKQDGMRFSTVLTRTEAFSYPDLDAITSYIMTGIHYPPNLQYNPEGLLTEAQARGKVIFERTHDNTGKEIPVINRCLTCHPAPYYTNLKSADVNTLAVNDDSIQFDTPHLNNIWASPPYLHDGRAKTLEEIWTLYGTTDKHGLVNDMTKNQLNDLVEYLKSLRSPDYELKASKIQKASTHN